MKPIICPICRSKIEINKHILNKIRFNQYFDRLSRLKENILSNGMHIINNIIYTSNNEIISNIDEQLASEYIYNNEPIIEETYFIIENQTQIQTQLMTRLRDEQIEIIQHLKRDLRIFQICLFIFVVVIFIILISIGAI